MSAYFLDSSALVKRYVDEIGSNWIRSLTDASAGNNIHVVALAAVEVTSAVVRRGRSGNLSAADVQLALGKLDSDFQTFFTVFQVRPALITAAQAIARTHGLRAYDCMQLAAALEVGGRAHALGIQIQFLSADLELNRAATSAGLTIDNPNLHP